MNVTFNNLITTLDLSQFFFEPSLGQTQQVSATFAEPVNWTLQIQDVSSITVRYVTGNTGTGASMVFNWDGTGTNGVTLPDGVYSYLLSTQTNGQALVVGGGGGNTNHPPPPPAPGSGRMAMAPASSTETAAAGWYPTSAQAAISAGWDRYFIEPPPLPPLKLNGKWVPAEDVYGPEPSVAVPVGTTSNASTFSQMAQSQYSGPSSQSTRGPKRKPRVGVKNKSGSFGVCYKTYPLGFSMQQPKNGQIPPLQPFTGVDGGAPNNGYISWSTLKTAKLEASGFAQGMKIGGFKEKFAKADEQWGPNDIKSSALGGRSIFNTCNFGLLSTHGCYGTNPEIDGVKYTYLALFDQTNGSAYVRLSDMDFGSTGTDGLRWMTILSCNTLFSNNVTSMANNSKLPDNSNLHLLLGFNSFSYSYPFLGLNYASNLVTHVTIWNSFVNGCSQSYTKAAQNPVARSVMTNGVIARVMGFQSCVNDSLYLYSDPDPNTPFEVLDQSVYTP